MKSALGILRVDHLDITFSKTDLNLAGGSRQRQVELAFRAGLVSFAWHVATLRFRMRS